MSNIAKIAIMLGASLVFLLVSVSILVKVVVTPEKVRENLLPLAEETLQRKISVGEIDIGIFSGVSLTDLQVQKRSAQGNFISVKSLSLHYKLLPLLTGAVVIDQVLLEEPNIEIIREADGSFNYSDLLAQENATSGVDEKEKKRSSGSSVLDLLVNQVVISGGELLFIDRSQNAKLPYRYNFNQFNFQASKITLDSAFPVEMSAALNGSKITVSGLYDIAKQVGDLDVQLRSLDLVKFAPYYRQSLPGKLGSAVLTMNLEAQIQPEGIVSKGKILLEGLDLALDDFPQAALQRAKLSLDYALAYNLKTQVLDVSTLLANFNNTALGAEGSVDLAGDEPELILSLLFDQLDLRTLFDDLPTGLTSDLQNFSLAGKLDGRVSLAGKPSDGIKLLKSADIELVDVKASVDTIRTGIAGKIHFSDQQAESEQLVLSIADQQVNLDFKANNLLSEIITGEFNISAEQLDLNQILPGTSASDKGSGPAAVAVERQASFAEEIGPFDLPLDMSGSLRVGKLLYKQLNLDHVRADLTLKDNHLQIKQLRSKVAGGEFSAATDVDLGVKGLQYQGQMKLDQSKLLPLVAGLAPQSEQSVSGLLQWQNNFSGRGTIPDNLLESLQVKGAIQLYRGTISGSPLLEQLALFLGVPDLKLLSFEALESRYDLRNGVASLSGKLDSSKIKMKPKGTIAVDGAMDVKLDMRIAPELMQKIGVKTGLKQSISDQQGWGILPLSIEGTLNRPKIAFDSEALQKQAASKVKEEASKRLLEEISPKGGKDQEPVKQLLEGTLNRLFGN